MSFVVRNISRNEVAKGGTVCIYGAGFSSFLKVWIGASKAVVLDYDYGFVQVAAPSFAGTFTLYAGESYENRLSVGRVIVAEDTKDLPIDLPENHTDESYRDAILGLMPRGFAWYKGADGVFSRLMLGLAKSVAGLYRLAAEFKINVSPSHTESLAVWETELALPENGVEFSGTAQEIELKRRTEIFRKACKKGGNTIPYFKSIAALFDSEIEIYEYWKNPEKFDGVDFGDDDPNFYWMVNLAARDEDWFVCTCNDTCNDYLQWWWNAPMETLFDLIKPAHTKLVYSYGDGRVVRRVHLLTESGKKLKTETGDNIVV